MKITRLIFIDPCYGRSVNIRKMKDVKDGTMIIDYYYKISKDIFFDFKTDNHYVIGFWGIK